MARSTLHSGAAPPSLPSVRQSSWTLRVPILSILMVIALAVAPASTFAQSNQPANPRVLSRLLSDAQKNPSATYRVIVTRMRNDSSADSYVAARGYRKLKDVGKMGFVASVKGKDIADIGRQSSVRQVTYDAPMAATDAPVSAADLATVYPAAIQASAGWSTGLTGNGIGVAVVDSGITSLPDFTSDGTTSRIVAAQSFNSSSTSTADGFGHGTHVAGTIAGNNWWGSVDQGKYVGVAPGANLIDVKVADDQGNVYESDVINGIEWAIANRQAYNIRVMNLSLASTVAESYTTDPLDAAAEEAWFSGILVVAASGNIGPNAVTYSPGNDPFVLTVGAADPVGTVATADDGIPFWSSYGATQDGFNKPDLVAPGRYITAPLASTTEVLAQERPTSVVDNAYLTLSGTSQATAVMSGVGALLFEAHPTWTNDQVKAAVVQSQNVTVLGGSQPIPGQGAGEVNVQADVSDTATPAYANQGIVISPLLSGPSGATVYSNTFTIPATSSWSTSSWSTSSWSTSSWSTSSWSTSSWSTSSWSTSSWSTSSWSTSSWSTSSWSTSSWS